MYKGHQRKYANLFVASLFSCLTIFQLGVVAQAETSTQTPAKKAKNQKLVKKASKKKTTLNQKLVRPAKVSSVTYPQNKNLRRGYYGASTSNQALPVKTVEPLNNGQNPSGAQTSGDQLSNMIGSQESRQPLLRRKDKEVTPSLLFIPNSGEFLADFGYSYAQGTSSGSTRSTAVTTIPISIKTDQNLGLTRFAYGMDAMYLGVGVDYAQIRERRTSNLSGTQTGQTGVRRERDSSIEGVGDPQLFGGYRFNTQSMAAVLSMNGTISPDKKLVEDPSMNSKENRFEGGNSVGIGGTLYNHDAETFLFGGQANYIVRFDRNKTARSTVDGTESTYTITGGNSYVLKAFMELPQASRLGLEYAYTRNERAQVRQESTLGKEDSTINPTTIQSVTAYINIEAHENFNLLPSLIYSTASGAPMSQDSFDRSNIFGAMILGRMKF